MWLKSDPTCFDIRLGDGARRRVSPYNDLLELPDLTKNLLVVAYRFENLQSLRARFVATYGSGSTRRSLRYRFGYFLPKETFTLTTFRRCLCQTMVGTLLLGGFPNPSTGISRESRLR